MKIQLTNFLILVVCLVFLACRSDKIEPSIVQYEKTSKRVPHNNFQQLLDSNDVRGSILIYNLNGDEYYSNDFNRCDSGFIPASTFKIPNTIIALETGVVTDENSIWYWDGVRRSRPILNQDLRLQEAFHQSCVPCYQSFAREIGMDRMSSYLQKLKFGHMVFDSSSIDMFWLQGNSVVTQFQQIDFLKRLYTSELKINTRTDSLFKKLMIVDSNDRFTLRGKTGLSTSGIGWYVGYVEVKNNVFFFATNIQHRATIDYSVRKAVTLQALKTLGAI